MKVLFQDSGLSYNEARVLATEVFLSGIDSVRFRSMKLTVIWRESITIFPTDLHRYHYDFVLSLEKRAMPRSSFERCIKRFVILFESLCQRNSKTVRYRWWYHKSVTC